MAAVSLMPCHTTHLSKRLWESSKKYMPCYSESQGLLFPSVAAWLNNYYLALCKHELMNPHTALRLRFSALLMWEKAGLERSLLCLLLQLWWPGKLQDCNALIQVSLRNQTERGRENRKKETMSTIDPFLVEASGWKSDKGNNSVKWWYHENFLAGIQQTTQSLLLHKITTSSLERYRLCSSTLPFPCTTIP